jgi:hypothetical protein
VGRPTPILRRAVGGSSSDSCRQGLVRACSSEVGLVWVESVDESVELTDRACDVQRNTEGHTSVALLQASEGAAVDASSLGDLLGGEPLELTPGGEV